VRELGRGAIEVGGDLVREFGRNVGGGRQSAAVGELGAAVGGDLMRKLGGVRCGS